jgi:hypothetical protein
VHQRNRGPGVAVLDLEAFFAHDAIEDPDRAPGYSPDANLCSIRAGDRSERWALSRPGGPVHHDEFILPGRRRRTAAEHRFAGAERFEGR